MSRQQDLDRLSHSIKEAEARLRVFKQTLDVVCNELEDLTDLKEILEENVSFLKKKHIIALAAEYKKAKDELNKTIMKLSKIRIDRDNILRAAKDVEDYLIKVKQDYANALKEPNNILAFRRKDGKE